MKYVLIAAVVLLLIACLFLLDSWYERKHLVVKEYIIENSKLPDAFDGYTIAFMSDLHNNEFGEGNVKLIDAVDKIKPDALLIGGDMLVAKGVKSIEVPVNLINKLASKYKTYYCYGNHEARLYWDKHIYKGQGDEYYEALKNAGVCVINDSRLTFKCKDSALSISGINIERKYYKKFSNIPIEVDELNKKLGKADKNAFNILLAHSSVSFKEYAEWGADLILSGHLHGGTVILPFLGALMSPDLVLFPKYYKGRYDEYGSTLILSGGLGTHSVNIRINNKPELIVIRLKKK